MISIILKEKQKELNLLREERIYKAKILYAFIEEIRSEMTKGGQMSPSKEIDPFLLAIQYANLLDEKKVYDNNDNVKINNEKYEIILRNVKNIQQELTHMSNNTYKCCEFEGFVRDNLKYLDLTKIADEVQNFNPFSYDMRNELFYICFTELNNIDPVNVREENKFYYEKLINSFISIQTTIVKLLDVRLQIEKEERNEKLLIEDKLSPDETLYIEKYLNILKEKLGLFILNTMKQNNIILSRKLYCIEENDVKLGNLVAEFGKLYEELILYISSYNPSKSLQVLPNNYAQTILPQVELIKTFTLSKVNDVYKR